MSVKWKLIEKRILHRGEERRKKGSLAGATAGGQGLTWTIWTDMDPPSLKLRGAGQPPPRLWPAGAPSLRARRLRKKREFWTRLTGFNRISGKGFLHRGGGAKEEGA